MEGFCPPVTPSKIVQDNWRFSIPIYQRLFVWESEQIDRLLEDLWTASQTKDQSPYYVGVITTVEQSNGKNGRVFSVVDGQQRLTFLLLFFRECLARAIKIENAKRFVFIEQDQTGSQLRIRFVGRADDEKDIRHYGDKEQGSITNLNFRQFHDRMEIFIKKHNNDWESKKEIFIQYVFDKTSFLVNELVGFSNVDLNLYFEKMNSTGRQLSPLEQLKGEFASLTSNLVSVWNDCFNFETTRKKAEDLRKGNKTTSEQLECFDGDGVSSIDDIIAWDKPIEKEQMPNRESNACSRLLMRPEVLALHTLCLTLKDVDNKISFSPRHLLEVFNNKLIQPRGPCEDPKKTAESFIEELKKYRDWIDENIIYLRGEELENDIGDSNSLGLRYAFRKEQDTKELDTEEKKKMLQLQSMLYVSSGESQEWILKAYEACKNENVLPQELSFDMLRKKASEWWSEEIGKDDESRKQKISELSYSSGMNRRIFWMLDYLLWEDHINNWCYSAAGWSKKGGAESAFDMLKLTDEEHRAVHNYIFRANRSIEHFRPQNGAKGKWIEEKEGGCRVLDSFGNLCMISSSFNSTQSDDSVNTKCGRIDDQVKAGRLESIKMLIMRKLAGEEKKWTPDQAIKHGGDMLKFLGFDKTSIENWKASIDPNT